MIKINQKLINLMMIIALFVMISRLLSH